MFNLENEVPRFISPRILRWASKIIASDFDMMYVKGNAILLEYILFRKEFGNETVENPEKAKDEIILWVEIEVLLLNRLRQYLVLSMILDRIQRNIWSNYSIAERALKETRHSVYWVVTWQFQKTILILFYFCSLNNKDVVSCPCFGTVKEYNDFHHQRSLFPFLYPFHILLIIEQ